METTHLATLDQLTGPELLSRIHAVLTDFQAAAEQCVSSGRVAIDRAIALGELFEYAVHRYPGEYEVWLKANFPQVSTMTAWRFRNCYVNRAKLEAGDPALVDLKGAYVALGLLPAPEEKKAGTTERTPHLYSLRLVVAADKPLTEWPKIELIEFVQQTDRIAELREEAQRILALE